MNNRTDAHKAGYQKARVDDESGDILAMVSYHDYDGHGLSPDLAAFWIMGYEHYMRLRSSGDVFRVDRNDLPE